MDKDTSIFEDIENADTVEEAAALALGAASVCWDEPPSGVFLSDKATLVLTSLMKRINN